MQLVMPFNDELSVEAIRQREPETNQEMCACCRKRPRTHGMKCIKCDGSDRSYAFPKDVIADVYNVADVDSICSSWKNAIENRQSGLRQRAKQNGMQWARRGDLVRKIVKQGFRCYFTKQILFPDDSLRLAHLKSASKGGSFVIDNLVWTTHEVNKMMGKMEYEQFVNICVLVTQIEDICQNANEIGRMIGCVGKTKFSEIAKSVAKFRS